MEPKVNGLVMREGKDREGKGRVSLGCLCEDGGKGHAERWEKIVSGKIVEAFEKWEKRLLGVLWKVRCYPAQAPWLSTGIVSELSYHC